MAAVASGQSTDGDEALKNVSESGEHEVLPCFVCAGRGDVVNLVFEIGYGPDLGKSGGMDPGSWWLGGVDL